LPVPEVPVTTMRSRATLLSCLAVASSVATPARAAEPTMEACLASNEGAIKVRADHKYRQARDESLACAAASCPAEVRATCDKRVRDMTAAIPTLVFAAKDPRGADLTAVTVTMDGAPLAPRLDGTALAVDPGEHVFSFATPGLPAVERRLVVYEAQKERRESIVFAAVVAPAGSPSTAERSGFFTTRRILGVGAAGVGVVSVAAGAVLGVLASSAWSRVKNDCGPGGPGSCSATDPASVTSSRSTAITDGTASTALFITGGVLAAAGAVLLLTGGSHEKAPPTAVGLTPTMGPGQLGLVLSGRY